MEEQLLLLPWHRGSPGLQGSPRLAIALPFEMIWTFFVT